MKIEDIRKERKENISATQITANKFGDLDTIGPLIKGEDEEEDDSKIKEKQLQKKNGKGIKDKAADETKGSKVLEYMFNIPRRVEPNAEELSEIEELRKLMSKQEAEKVEDANS